MLFIQQCCHILALFEQPERFGGTLSTVLILSCLMSALFVWALISTIFWVLSAKKANHSSEQTGLLTTQIKQLEAEKASLLTAQSNKKDIEESFKGAAQLAFESTSEKLFRMAQSGLEGQLTQGQKSFEQLLQPLKENLKHYQELSQGFEKDRQKVFGSLESQIKKVAEATYSLSHETTALTSALKKPNVRGRWGELQLKNCIELAGMSEYSDVSFQDQYREEGSNTLIPDMTVKMPGGRQVIVDAKTPLDAFLSSLEATNDLEKKQNLERHGKHLKDHVKKLSAKDYGKNIPNSADFTVMFLPNESFLYAALETQPDIVEFALQKKVLIATPPTFIGLLKVIGFGWNEEKLAQNAQKISEVGIELHKRMSDFLEAYEKVGLNLDKAQKQYDMGLQRIKSRILPQATKLETLGAKSKKDFVIKSDTALETNSDTNLLE